MRLARSRLALGLAAALSMSTSPSRAHIDLRTPLARAPGRPDTFLGEKPCGQVANARDPERVSTFEPGQTIVVEWDVYQRHVSYFRVALDLDGDDSFSERPSRPAGPDSDDPTQLAPNPGERILAYVEDEGAQLDHVAQPVTLPDEECERCTLQVIQFTYGLPLRDATYHQCADLVLKRTAPGEGDAGSGGVGMDALAGSSPSAAGCALSAPGRAPGERGLALAALAVTALARRRARSLRQRLTQTL
jgi:hypothetical protein